MGTFGRIVRKPRLRKPGVMRYASPNRTTERISGRPFSHNSRLTSMAAESSRTSSCTFVATMEGRQHLREVLVRERNLPVAGDELDFGGENRREDPLLRRERLSRRRAGRTRGREGSMRRGPKPRPEGGRHHREPLSRRCHCVAPLLICQKLIWSPRLVLRPMESRKDRRAPPRSDRWNQPRAHSAH